MTCKNFVTKMKNHGFLIAQDDIGKGNSTMKYDLELEPNIVKLDRYFAMDLASFSEKK